MPVFHLSVIFKFLFPRLICLGCVGDLPLQAWEREEAIRLHKWKLWQNTTFPPKAAGSRLQKRLWVRRGPQAWQHAHADASSLMSSAPLALLLQNYMNLSRLYSVVSLPAITSTAVGLHSFQRISYYQPSKHDSSELKWGYLPTRNVIKSVKLVMGSLLVKRGLRKSQKWSLTDHHSNMQSSLAIFSI